jgi:DNA-binding response OmpR family regulator
MATSGLNLGVSSLASGLRVCVEGEDVAHVMLVLRRSSLLAVQWDREGAAELLRAQLLREARWSKPDVWLLAGECDAVVERVRALRAAEGGVPILVLSKEVEHSLEVRALEAGADSCCRWPDDADALPSRIRALLRRASGTFRIALRKTIELHCDGKRLFLGDELVRLSTSEYQLLHRLDQTRNEWVQNDDLWAVVAPGGVHAHDSSLLRTHFLRLRKKLGGWGWIIRTERGRGTMLSDVPP